jgi:hypothetical protein
VIKASGRTTGGKPLLLLGLSVENAARLLAGQPIGFDTAALGLPPMQVVIVGGQTEDAIAAELAAHGLIPPQAPRD